MIMQHLMLEVYCDHIDLKKRTSCLYENGKTIGSHCFDRKCQHLSFTKTENEIAYVGESGVVEESDEWIGFGGDMEPVDDEKRKMLMAKWKEICKKKMDEAYKEYMTYKNNIEKY